MVQGSGTNTINGAIAGTGGLYVNTGTLNLTGGLDGYHIWAGIEPVESALHARPGTEKRLIRSR